MTQTIASLSIIDQVDTTSTNLAIVEPLHGALSDQLQAIARRYIDARQRHGQALLDAAAALNEAREAAAHGDWLTFLEATHTKTTAAQRLLAIHAKAQADPAFADAVKRDWLSFSVAALLAQPSTPNDVVAQALAAPEPPPKRAIEDAIKSTTGGGFEASRTLQQIRDQHADLFTRLSVHGWDSVGKPRSKGITTFVSFRHGGTGEENELAEGELPYWVEQLDDSKARREAQRKPAETADHIRAAEDARKDAISASACRTNIQQMRDYPESAVYPKHARNRAAEVRDPQLRATLEAEIKAARRVEPVTASAVVPVVPVTPLDPALVDLQQRAETFGFTLHQRSNGYELFRNGERYSVTPDLAPVADTIRTFEEGARKRAEQAAPAPVEAPAPLTTFEAFDAIIDQWQRQRSAAVGLVELCCLTPEQRDHREPLSRILYGWANSLDREHIAAVLAEAETQIALPPFIVKDRVAFEAEVRDLLETTVIPDDYPLVTGMLKAVARYVAMQEVA